MATLPYSWQECRLCGGAYLLWFDPSAPLDTDETGLGERWTEWVHLDGRGYDEADSAACNTCGGLDLESMTAPQRRWGLSLPGVTITAMRARGLTIPGGAAPLGRGAVAPAPFGSSPPPAPPTSAGWASSPPTAQPVQHGVAPTGGSTSSPDHADVPADAQGPASPRPEPFLLALVRSLAAAPRSTVQTYAPREPLELNDPLVWIVIVTAAVTLTAVVIGWFTSPGNVPQ